jgi:hypothetical protein
LITRFGIRGDAFFWGAGGYVSSKKYSSRRSLFSLAKDKQIDILAAVKRTAIPHHATFLGWSLNGVDASPKNA